MPVQYYSRGRIDAPGDLFVATPSLDEPKPNYIAAWEKTRAALAEAGIAADYLLHVGDCHVDDARNVILRKFLDSGCPKILFIDADVGWEADEFLHFIRHKRDVVAAVYPKKQDEPEFPVMPFAGTVLQADADGLVRVRGVPTGFLMISRAAVEKMVARSVPYYQHQDDEVPTPLVFERGIVNGKRWSGDYYFCRKWAELGGSLYVDPEMHLSHCGLKTWEGTLGDHWREKHGVIDPHLDGAFKLLRAGNMSEAVFRVLAGRSGNYPWCAEPEMLKLCAEMAGGKITLEIGSGLSTIIMGMACLETGGEVHTLEHDWGWFRKTRDLIKRYKLPANRLYYAPLREQPDGSAWHEVPPELPKKFHLAVIDGPPRNLANRDTVWRVLGQSIATADWIVDDIGNTKKYESWGRLVDKRGRFALIKPDPTPSALLETHHGEHLS